MLFRQTVECAIFTLLVALSRYLCRSHYLYDLDSVNFALGIGRFDPVAHQPHPPGYFLYVYLARAVNMLLGDANTSLVAISILASCGAVVVIYFLTLQWFGPTAARFTGLIFLVSPLTWFHGTVALIYIVEAFASALVGYLCWQVYCGREQFAVPAAVLLGISAGVRPSFLLFLTPLFLFSLRQVSLRRILLAVAALGLALLGWFIPMIEASGGFRAYAASFMALWHVAGGKETVMNSSPLTSLVRLLTIGLIYSLCFGSAILLSGRVFRPSTEAERSKKVFTLVWMAPGLTFFTFVFLLFVNSGYLLVVFPPLFAWLGLWAAEWYRNFEAPGSLKIAVVALLATINVLIFLEGPMYCSYKSVRQFEAEIRDLRQSVRRIASPGRTLIVGFDSHFLGYRHAGYYLPRYATVQYPEVKLAVGPRVFAMHNRDTQLIQQLKPGGFTQFLFFPLPSDERAYTEYMDQVKAKFPKNALHTIRSGNHTFIFGPISDLPTLFPDAAPAALYTRRHAIAAPVYNR
jgi:4-amino-4-deoxy-L-arabinose transferase-like glycosyltransferase